jgi:hypothetical protein
MLSLLERLLRRMCVGGFYWEPGLPSLCMYWKGAVDRCGHGRVKVHGHNLHVRRALFAAHGVTLTPDEHVIALCKFGWCVNYEHLVVGTEEEARAFGRFGRLGPGDVLMAQQMITNGEATAKHIAECWDISEKLLISAIARCRLNDLVLKKAS